MTPDFRDENKDYAIRGQQSRHHDGPEHARRQRQVVIAVVISVLVIAVAWILLLPYQIEGMQLFKAEEVQKWEEMNSESSVSLDGLRNALDNLKNRVQSLDPTDSRIVNARNEEGLAETQEVIEKLREKINENAGQD